MTVGGDPARREAYVGIQDDVDSIFGVDASSASTDLGGTVVGKSAAVDMDVAEKGFVLPQPLWGLV